MRLLDRYVLRNFLRAYLFCIAAFLAIWVVFDFSDKISTFLDQNVTLGDILHYYLTQLPAIIVVVLPVALLLAVTACLSRMSRTNEIVSMLTAGISVPRVLLPLIAIGLVTVAASGALNYALAPHAEQESKGAFQEMRGEEDTRQNVITGQVFRNRMANRTWFIQQFRIDEETYHNVQILQQDEQDNIVSNTMAAEAVYLRDQQAWRFGALKLVKYDASGNITEEQNMPELIVRDWDETPFRLFSSNMRAEYLSVAELREYLHFNSDFPPTLLAPFATHLQYRLALPWTCLIIVIIAAPLAIGFSRKGTITSIVSAIALVFSMNFFTHLFLALGEGYRISPVAAAWTPNIIFALVGAGLLYFRSTNREARELNPFAARVVAT